MLSYGSLEDVGGDWLEHFRQSVSMDGVRVAEEIVREAGIPRTPLMRHPLLVEEAGCELYLKHENHLPTGSFKVRGGLTYMKHFSEESDAAGVVTATRGNHGQSIGLAAQKYGVRCVVCVPKGNNPEKNAAMRAYGVELVEHGKDYDEAREYAIALCAKEGLHYVHASNEPHLINGVGTYWTEVAEALPDAEVVVVPIGGGSGACAAITVLRSLSPDTQIIGVQAENAPAIYESWKKGECVETKTADTIADGLATRVAFELPLAILRDGIDDILLVSEEEIRGAIELIWRTTHNMVEGAAAATVAAILRNHERFADRKVVAVMSGGNLDTATLRSIFGA